jgi:TorA maturation chaperone TorD
MNQAPTTYRLLAVALHYPDEALLEGLREIPAFRRCLRRTNLEFLQNDYIRLFTPTVAGGLPPYETEYGKTEIFLKTQMLADIAGFYRAFGLDMADSSHERVDFIGAELELMDWLTLKEERARERGLEGEAQVCREGAAKFLRDHLGRWAGYFGDRIAAAARHPFYELIGRWLSRFIASECQRLGVEPEKISDWTPEPDFELECGPDDLEQPPQPLTITK